ncbi:MAG: IS30 family transposase [Tatlockia sp.]|nr:IS30 family transposase [Tatlockia sp.]
MSYKHLNFAQRCKISAFWKAGYQQKEIAEEIGVSPSTISRELKRNSRWNYVYCPDQAAASYKLRRKNSKKPKKFTETVRAIVDEKLRLEWSPEQISGYGKHHGLFKISHERIYQYILADKKSGGKLYLHLRCGKKKYRKRYGSPKRTHTIKNRVFIDDRPEVVNQKLRFGDWEIDTIIGKDHKDAIVTIVERLSKKTVIGRVTTKKALEVATEVVFLLSPIKRYVLTITSDNGCEFAQHEWIARNLETSIYFAHPYHSWERGLNENTNGLIRQYIPKGSSFSDLTPERIKEIENRINSRPRKSLNYFTPDEIFYKQQRA